MPIPWDPELLKKRRTKDSPLLKNRHPRENGITFVQLSEMKEFLKRMCKSGLLCHTSICSKQDGTHGERIKWTEINMHVINNEVIMKMIPKENSCSWIEIRSAKPQKPKVFVSHDWSEPFRDFLKAIELYKASAGISVHCAFFICTFANDQWHVDLGETLSTSPFYLALSRAESVLLMLDKLGSALGRIWCVFELHTTLKKQKKLAISTPLGMMGDEGMQSLQVTEVLKSVDVRHAQATNPVDQRQIMNNIAGVNEEEGLGKYEDGRKFLTDSQRSFGGETLQYEYNLLQQHADKFEELNCGIRQYANAGLHNTSGRDGCVVKDPAGRALTLEQMRVMHRTAKTYFLAPQQQQWREDNKVDKWDDVTFIHLMNKYFKEYVTECGKSSYMECVAEGPQFPQYMATEAFQMSVHDFMAAVEWHAEARALPPCATYWLLPAAMLQQDADDYIQKNHLSPTFIAMQYYEGQVVVLDKDASILGRALPCLEIHGILERHKSMDLACSSGALAATRPFAEGWEFGSFDAKLANMILMSDVANIVGKTVDGCDHAEMTKCRVAGMPYENGKRAPEQAAGYDSFNLRLHSKAFGPVLRGVVVKKLASDGNKVQLQKLLDTDTCVPLTCTSLHGLLGETALHIAAGCGHQDVVKLLLERAANPNQQDNDGETPLHYAAMAGQLGCAEELLQSGADPSIESYYIETPAYVARQNPAVFLGVDTSKIADLCEDNMISRTLQRLPPPGCGAPKLCCLLM